VNGAYVRNKKMGWSYEVIQTHLVNIGRLSFRTGRWGVLIYKVNLCVIRCLAAVKNHPAE